MISLWIKTRRETPHLASCDVREKRRKKELISIYTALVPGTKYPGCHSFVRITRLFPFVLTVLLPYFLTLLRPLNLVLQFRRKSARKECFSNTGGWLTRPLRHLLPCFLALFSFLLVLLFLFVAPFFICAKTSPLRNVRLIRTCYSRRQHKDNTLMSGDRLPSTTIRTNFPFRLRTRWLLVMAQLIYTSWNIFLKKREKKLYVSDEMKLINEEISEKCIMLRSRGTPDEFWYINFKTHINKQINIILKNI